MKSILIIEDDHRVAVLLKKGLEELGYRTEIAFDGQLGLRLYHTIKPDIVISDVVLPKMSGFEVAKEIKAEDPTVPILMLTALGTTDDKLEGFDAGADDYLVKPFDFRELEARIKALLKRQAGATEATAPQNELNYADLHIDLLTKIASRGNQTIKLTPKEFYLLTYLMQNPERVLSRTEIAEKVWSTHFDTGTNFIDVYINYLRKKIDRDFDSKLIHTKPGMGFILMQDYEDRT